MSTTHSEEFSKANKVSLEIAKSIESSLKFVGMSSLIPVINSMSLCLKLPGKLKQRNSTLNVSPRGCGKSTLLIHILAKSNPRYFQVLPKKMFESLLLEEPKEYFHNKILVHDDIIIALGGMNKKQREQLTGFFTLLLSDGSYGRKDKSLENINCIAHFGIAQESFAKHRKDLTESTFLDRFACYGVKFSHEQKMQILEYKDSNSFQELPKIKLPLRKQQTPIEIDLSEEELLCIRQLAMELDMYGVMSSTRAHSYIKIFLMSNALLNNRKVVSTYDLQLYQILHKFHLDSAAKLSKKQKVLALKRRFPTKNIEELAAISGISKSTIYRELSKLEKNGEL